VEVGWKDSVNWPDVLAYIGRSMYAQEWRTEPEEEPLTAQHFRLSGPSFFIPLNIKLQAIETASIPASKVRSSQR